MSSESVDDYGDDYGGRIRNSLVIRSRRRSRPLGSAVARHVLLRWP